MMQEMPPAHCTRKAVNFNSLFVPNLAQHFQHYGLTSSPAGLLLLGGLLLLLQLLGVLLQLLGVLLQLLGVLLQLLGGCCCLVVCCCCCCCFFFEVAM